MPYKDKEAKNKYMREWYDKNKDTVAKYHANYYDKSKDRFLGKQKERNQQRRELIGNIALKYGCQNPACLWDGPFEPCQLDFHHLDPKTKNGEVGSMTSSSIDAIIEEVNKCVVLCRNCHAAAHWGDEIKIDESMLCKETTGKCGCGSSFSV
jgi:hypothetical protein